MASVVLLVAFLAGCRPDADTAGRTPTVRHGYGELGAARCDVRTSAMGARNVLTLRDIDPTATGGTAITDVDYRGCAPMTTPLGWRCDIAFPWQTATATGPAMATLGVTHARVAYVVTPVRTVTETILDVAPASSGAEVVRHLERACPRHQAANAGAWVRFGPNTAVLATRRMVVAIDFTDGSWSLAQQQPVLRAAAAVLGRG